MCYDARHFARPWLLLRRLPLDVWPVLLLGAFVLALFAPAVFGGRTFFENDIFYLWAPQTEVFVRTVAGGAWPFWNPYVAFGQPMLANANYQVLYPPTWVNLLLLQWPALTLLAVGHLVAAGAGLYLLSLRLGCGRVASCGGALFWMTSGPLLSLLCRWNHFMAAAWMPWLLLACLGRSRRALVAAAAAAAAQLLAGSPEVFAMSALAGLMLAATPREGRWHRVGRLLGALALALGLSAAQLLPSWAMAQRSERALAAIPEVAPGSAHPWNFAQLIWPVPVEELRLSDSVRQELFEGREPYLSSLYLGLGSLPFVLLGVARAGRWRGFLVAVMAGAVLVALGTHTPAYGMTVRLLPFLAMIRFPVKAALALALVWSLACALGIEAAVHTRVPRFVLAGAAALTGGAWLLVAATGWGPSLVGSLLAPGVDVAAELRPASVALLAAASLATLGLGLLIRGGPAAAVAAALLALGDVTLHNRGINETADTAVFRGMPSVVPVLRESGASRIYVWDSVASTTPESAGPEPRVLAPPDWSIHLAFAAARQSLLMPPLGARWGFRGSFDPDIVLIEPAEVRNLYGVFRLAEGSPAFVRLLRLAAVERVVSLHDASGSELTLEASVETSRYDTPIRVWRVPEPRPRAYVVGASRSLEGTDALLRLLAADFDPAREAVVAPAPRLDNPVMAGQARFLEDRPDRLRIEASLPAAGYLVIADAFDPGWRAQVDGTPVPLLRANAAFRAVALSAGKHVVEMQYWPHGLDAGLALSGLSLLAAAALWRIGRESAPRA